MGSGSRTVCVWLPAWAVTVAMVAACAQGGRGRTGAPTPDGGPTAIDGGARDASPPDAFTPGVDAGPAAIDSGPGLRLDSGPSDVDGGPPPPDAGPPPCTSAAECDDGIACNGVERCGAGTCTAGAPLTCDDGIACTNDTCVEPGSCNYAPADTRCPAGQTCDVARGCVSGCAETPCRLTSPQCGCPTGQGCYIDTAGTRLCATAGTGLEGATCAGIMGCRAGNLCINVSATGTANICSRFCNADADCAAGALCIIELNDGAGGTLPGVTLCTHACDPVTNSGCATGTGCDIYQETAGAMRLFFDCGAPVGTGTQGAPCPTADSCRASYACLDPDGAGAMPQQCLHWCNVGTGAGCSGATVCVGFTSPIRVGATEYGVCL